MKELECQSDLTLAAGGPNSSTGYIQAISRR